MMGGKSLKRFVSKLWGAQDWLNVIVGTNGMMMNAAARFVTCDERAKESPVYVGYPKWFLEDLRP